MKLKAKGKRPQFVVIEVITMATSSNTLEIILKELRQLNKKIDSLERLLYSLIIAMLPEEEISEEEVKELKRVLEEVKNETYVTLEDLKNV